MTVEAFMGLFREERVSASYAAGYWSGESVEHLLRRQATQRPESIAVIERDRRLTWCEVYGLSRTLARHLIESGVQPDDLVLIQLPNWWEHVVAYHAIQLVGAVAVQIDPDWRRRELEYLFRVCRIRAIIAAENFRNFDYVGTYRKLAGVHELPIVIARGDGGDGDQCSSLTTILRGGWEKEFHASAPELQRAPDEISRVVFTSGTTGEPKAILHTTNTTRFSSRTIAQAYGVQPEDVALSYLPLSTNAGSVWSLYLPLETGMAVVLMDRFSAEGVLRHAKEEGVSLYCGSPTSLQAILASPTFVARDLASVRLIISSASSCPPHVIRSVRTEIGAPFAEVYGMNELGWATSTPPSTSSTHADGTIGRPYPGVEVRAVSATGGDQPEGQPGEMLLRSPGMCVGYHEAPELNAEAWDEDGWLRTGDYVTIDSSRNITLVGREKDLIIRGGANVSPREVEEALAEHPKVKDVAVVGIPDETYGELVCACVIPEAGRRLALEELKGFLMPKIAFYKIPTRLFLCDAFPATSMGKVRRHILRDRVIGRVGD